MSRHIWDDLDDGSDIDGLDAHENAPDIPWPVTVIVFSCVWLLMILATVFYTASHMNCRATDLSNERITCHGR